MKCSLWLATLILALAGCVSPEHFDTAKVDKNGSFYINCSPAALTGSYSELCDSVIRTTATDRSLDQTLANQIISDTLRTKILLQYSGLNEIKQLKASSTPRPDGTFTNCAALLVEPDNKSGISIFGSNCDLRDHIASLPDNCLAADVLSLDLSKLWASLENSKLDLKTRFAAYINVIFGTTPEKLAASHSGVFTFAAFPPQNTPNICLIVPDKDKQLYNRLKTFAGENAPAEFTVPLNNNGKIYVAAQGERLVLCSSDAIRKNILKPEKTLADTPEFAESPVKTVSPCVKLG